MQIYRSIDPLPEGHMRFIIPSCFVPIITQSGKGERPARIAYALDYICTTRYDDNRAFVTLNSRVMRKHIGSVAYERFLNLCGPYLKTDSYEVGVHAKGYRLTESYRKRVCVAHVMKCPGFRRRIEKMRKVNSSTHGPQLEEHIHSQLLKDLSLLKYDIEDPYSFVRNLPPKKGVVCNTHRHSVILASIYKIYDHSYNSPKLDKNGRLHHILTNTSRAVRKCLTLDNEPVVEVDLANSQPFFMAALFKDIPNLTESTSSGKFYEDVNRQLELPYDLSRPEDKALLKKHCIMRIFAKPNKGGHNWWEDPKSPVKKIGVAMDSAFPGIQSALDNYRNLHGSTGLANDLQKLESKVFIEKSLPKIQSLGIRAIPIHDSFLCKISDAGIITQIVREELFKQTEMSATIRGQK
jgi:hypothetical protein